MEGGVAQELFACKVEQVCALKLLSDEHLTGAGTRIEAWASHKRFRPKDGSGGYDADGEGGFRRQQRRNETHESITDPDAQLYRKSNGQESRLAF